MAGPPWIAAGLTVQHGGMVQPGATTPRQAASQAVPVTGIARPVRARPPDRATRRPQGPDSDGTASWDGASPTPFEPEEPGSLLRTLTAGRTALLAGALGFLAQLLSHRIAGTAAPENAAAMGLTALEAQRAIETYRTANRAVGAVGTAGRQNGLEILVDPFGAAASTLDDLA